MTRGRAGSTLDKAMPTWGWNEFHRIAMPGEHAGVIEAAAALTWADVPLFRNIMKSVSFGRVAGCPDDQVLDLFREGPYVEAHRDEEELVYVGFLQSSRSAAPLELAEDPLGAFRRAMPPRSVKVAMNFLFRDGEFSTETRCAATDGVALRAFSLYWLAIRGGSGLIRGSWLRGIRRKVGVLPIT